MALIDTSGDGLIQFSEFVVFFKPDLDGAKPKNMQKTVTAKLETATRSFADQLKDINSLRDLEESARAALDELHNLEARTLQHFL
jgi:hypothetical protein